jgi:hypothetical protein
MLLAGSSDGWSWEQDAFPPVAFCVRTLVLDGLKVPPFDRHGGGDGRLRAVGLDVAVWRDWLTVILRQRATLADVARRLGSGDLEVLRAQGRAAGEVLHAPGSFCGGPRELQDRLNEIWEGYAPIGEDWKRRMSEADRDRFRPARQRWLWKALLPFHDRLPTLSVFLVAYGEPVVLPLPPTTCLIAPAGDAAAYGRQVVDAASQLAAAL